jgi:hypothetical protein
MQKKERPRVEIAAAHAVAAEPAVVGADASGPPEDFRQDAVGPPSSSRLIVRLQASGERPIGGGAGVTAQKPSKSLTRQSLPRVHSQVPRGAPSVLPTWDPVLWKKRQTRDDSRRSRRERHAIDPDEPDQRFGLLSDDGSDARGARERARAGAPAGRQQHARGSDRDTATGEGARSARSIRHGRSRWMCTSGDRPPAGRSSASSNCRTDSREA